MLNTMIVAAVTNFSGTTTPDKNGETPVMLQCIAGTMPNRNVLSGTVARRAGLEVGRTYLVNVRETGFDDLFGPDYTFIKIMELTTGLDIVRAAKELGDARIMYVLRPEGFSQSYERKGDAVESSRTKRIREGHYHPSVPTTVIHHETAARVVDGTSVGSGGRILRDKPAQFGSGNEATPKEEGGDILPTPRNAGEPQDLSDELINYEGDEDDLEPPQDGRNSGNVGTEHRENVDLENQPDRLYRENPDDDSDTGKVQRADNPNQQRGKNTGGGSQPNRNMRGETRNNPNQKNPPQRGNRSENTGGQL